MCACVRAHVCDNVHGQVTSGSCQSTPSVQLLEQGAATREVAVSAVPDLIPGPHSVKGYGKH